MVNHHWLHASHLPDQLHFTAKHDTLPVSYTLHSHDQHKPVNMSQGRIKKGGMNKAGCREKRIRLAVGDYCLICR
jgi:hypothetical protein